MAENKRTRVGGVIVLVLLMAGCTQNGTMKESEVPGMQMHYLEVVTHDVDAVCRAYMRTHNVKFGEPDTLLGNARTAKLHGGGLVGVRLPLRDDETPVVRPYWLVDDIKVAVSAVEMAGGEIALPPMEIPGRGTIAIYFLGNIQHGLWQL